jgi:orotate phosphoribosyltransferase
MKEELIDILCRRSFKYTEEPSFKLVSGRMSRFYVNCKPTTLSARGMYLVGHLMFDAIKDSPATAVGGLTFGADPIAVATAFASAIQDQPVNEGDVQPGQAVVIIDYVATTGGSTIKAIERARSEGLEVVKSVILVDRQEGGLDNIREHVADVSAIVTRDELMKRWKGLKKGE